MPLYPITNSYSDPITVAPGDAVQNTGRHMLFLCFATPADDDDAIELWPGQGLAISTATSMRVRCGSRHGGACKVVRGI